MRGNSYFAQRAVPKYLVAANSKSVIEISLKTADLIEARIKRDLFLANCNEEFRRLKATGVITPDSLQQIQNDMAESPELIHSLKKSMVVTFKWRISGYYTNLGEIWTQMRSIFDYILGDQAPIDRENARGSKDYFPLKPTMPR